MKVLRFASVLFLILTGGPACATWSVIIIDPLTKEIGIAGASCSPNCYGIGAVVPGKGAVVVQAMSNSDARQKAIQMILTGAPPAEIIEAIKNQMYDFERQQYAVISFQHINEPASYSGALTNDTKGTVMASGITVQGNTLANEEVLQKVFDAVMDGKKRALPMHELLMLALAVGSDAGGDKRCGAQKSTSAFITIFKPSDKPNKPTMDLRVFGQHKGGPNAVVVLRRQYDKWVRKREKKNS
jgi:uncharacterized Ntn-hydrolase superfamily protein